MNAWLKPEVLASLPDPVAASLQVMDLQLRHYVAAVLAGETSRALGQALNLQRECARLGDWARLAGWHEDKQKALSAGGGAVQATEGTWGRPTDAAERAAYCREEACDG